MPADRRSRSLRRSGVEAFPGETIAAAPPQQGSLPCARPARERRADRLRHGRLLRLPGDGRRPPEPARLPDQGRRRHGCPLLSAARQGRRRRRPRRACSIAMSWSSAPGRPGSGGAWPRAGRGHRRGARRAPARGRPVLQAAGATARSGPRDARPPVPRWRRARLVGPPGRRQDRQRATVWAAFSAHEVAATVAGQSRLYRPKRLVLATGAYEQIRPVPGWTLPGVMTVGGLQTLARSYRVAPGSRIVIAGNGPLCLQTAAELLDGGAMSSPCSKRRRARVQGDGRASCSCARRSPSGAARAVALAKPAGPLMHWRRRVTACSARESRARCRGWRPHHRCRCRRPQRWLRLVVGWRGRWVAPTASWRAAAGRWRP